MNIDIHCFILCCLIGVIRDKYWMHLHTNRNSLRVNRWTLASAHVARTVLRGLVEKSQNIISPIRICKMDHIIGFTNILVVIHCSIPCDLTSPPLVFCVYSDCL